MIRVKTIGMILLLAALTCGMIFMPQWIREKSEEAILGKTVTRVYHAESRAKLTAEQVARLYCDRQISMDYLFSPSSSTSEETDDISKYKNEVAALTDVIFGENEPLCAPIKQALTDGSITYSSRSTLIKNEDQPYALNFIWLVAEKEGVFFGVLYEEKTEAILQVSLDIYDNGLEEEPEQVDYTFENAERSIDSYYQNRLNLTEEEFYFSTDVTYPWKNNGFNIHIDCGLHQLSDKDPAETIY